MSPHATPAALERQRECPLCGLIQHVPKLPPNRDAACLRCDTVLRTSRPGALNKTTAFTITALILHLVAISSPFLAADIFGRARSTTMLSLPIAFWQNGAWELAVIVFVTAILAPLVKLLAMLAVLLGLRVANPPASLPVILRQCLKIGPWAMPEVFLLGVFVAFTRLGAIATVNVGVALYCIGALIPAMILADYYLDPEEAWDAMQARGLIAPAQPVSIDAPLIGCRSCGRVNQAPEGTPCSRCRAPLRIRAPRSLAYTWALVVASLLLYIPANTYPILTLVRLGRSSPSTIIGGAQELLASGLWPLALLVFVASIMVPILKLASLAFMLITVRMRSGWHLQDRTRLYRIIEFIGRWSMIDVFMLATLVGLVHSGAIATIYPEVGAVCFGSVVVLTMIAVSCFDPRLMWDAAASADDLYDSPPPHGVAAGQSAL